MALFSLRYIMNKNEKTFFLGEKEISLRATFRALASIEDKTTKPFVTLVQEAAEGRIRVSDVVTVLKEASKAAGQPLTEQDIDELLASHGVVGITQALAEFLSVALYGGTDKLSADEKKVPTE